MTWVDALVLLFVGASALWAFMRGFVREALGLFAWVGALYLATACFSAVEPEVRGVISNTEIADPVAFFIVFVVALIALSIAAGLAARGIRHSSLSGLDRTFGMLFGILRGGLIVSAAYIGLGLLIPVAQWPQPLLQARCLGYVYEGAHWIADQVPTQYTPHVDPPPSGTEGSAILQAAPSGTATGPSGGQ